MTPFARSHHLMQWWLLLQVAQGSEGTAEQVQALQQRLAEQEAAAAEAGRSAQAQAAAAEAAASIAQAELAHCRQENQRLAASMRMLNQACGLAPRASDLHVMVAREGCCAAVLMLCRLLGPESCCMGDTALLLDVLEPTGWRSPDRSA